MLTAKQIHKIMWAHFDANRQSASLEEAAEKIHELTKPDYSLHTAAAALENEVTSTLLDMLAATILATLIEQEGGGRTNISFSPGAMQEVLSNWTYTSDVSDMVRTVRIQPKRDGEWGDTTESPADAKLESLLVPEPAPADDIQAKPQAPVHEYNRPEWVVAYTNNDGERIFLRAHDRSDAGRQYRSLRKDIVATIENRWCLHTDCPSTGCNHDASLRDEVTSDEK